MVTLRCTQRLLKRLGVIPSSAAIAPSTRLGDWYAGWVPLRRPLILCLNETTLLAVLVPAAPIHTFLARWIIATGELLLALEVPAPDVKHELEAMRRPMIGATASRRILGCLNEATHALRWLHVRDKLRSLRDAELHLASNIYSTTGYQYPRDLARAAFRLPQAAALH